MESDRFAEAVSDIVDCSVRDIIAIQAREIRNKYYTIVYDVYGIADDGLGVIISFRNKSKPVDELNLIDHDIHDSEMFRCDKYVKYIVYVEGADVCSMEVLDNKFIVSDGCIGITHIETGLNDCNLCKQVYDEIEKEIPVCDGDEYTMNEVDLSIVTVVYNGEEYLEQTIQSVLNQCSMGIEYILVDGGSTDGTMSIVNKYIDQIDVVVSEEDCGIYDAMNKGLEISSKRYIYFLNSNDFFSSHDVLRNIDFKSDVIMANTCGIGDDGVVKTYFRTSYSTMDSLEKMLVYGDTCSHQGIFIKKKNHKKFIEELKLDADRVVIASNIHSAKSIQLINRDIVFARLGGASSNNYRMIFDKFIIPRYVKDIDRLRYYFYFLLVASKKIAREFLLAIGLWRVK